jgi:hypothetical protein
VLLHAHLRRGGDAAPRGRVEAYRRAALARDRVAAELAGDRAVASATALLAHGPLVARAATLDQLAAGLGTCLAARTPDRDVVEVLPPGSGAGPEEDDTGEGDSGPILPPSPFSRYPRC